MAPRPLLLNPGGPAQAENRSWEKRLQTVLSDIHIWKSVCRRYEIVIDPLSFVKSPPWRGVLVLFRKIVTCVTVHRYGGSHDYFETSEAAR